MSLTFPALAGRFFTRAPPGKPKHKELLLKARNHEEEGLLEQRPDLETKKEENTKPSAIRNKEKIKTRVETVKWRRGEL